MTNFVNSLGIILFATLVYATPLLYGALGSCFSEVSGVVRLTPVHTEEGCSTRKNVIRVYIPEPGESAWDVSKRFRLPAEAESADGVYVI